MATKEKQPSPPKEKEKNLTSEPVDESQATAFQTTEDLPHLPGGDVDVARVPKKSHKGELPAPILEGYWVRLGKHKDVPDRFVGHIASVVSSPVKPVPFFTGEEDLHGYKIIHKGLFTVQTRDEASATLVVPFEAFDGYSDSRATLQNFA